MQYCHKDGIIILNRLLCCQQHGLRSIYISFCLQYSYFALRGYASVVSLLFVVDTRIINFHKMTYHPLGNIILNINKNFDAYAKGIQDKKI